MSCLNYKKNTFNIQQLTRLREDSCYKTNRTSKGKETRRHKSS